MRSVTRITHYALRITHYALRNSSPRSRLFVQDGRHDQALGGQADWRACNQSNALVVRRVHDLGVVRADHKTLFDDVPVFAQAVAHEYVVARLQPVKLSKEGRVYVSMPGEHYVAGLAGVRGALVVPY